MQTHAERKTEAAVAAAPSPASTSKPVSYPYSRRLPGASDFPGCEPVSIKRDEVEDYDGRFEYWTAENETAWMVCEPTGAVHEQPGQRVARLGEVIAGVRGSPIECFGSMDLELQVEPGRRWRIMQADQAVYLYPRNARLPLHGMVIGEHTVPDVVLEVDHTTDVRRHKLKLYEEWGFPEIWVEVPDRDPRYGPRRGRRPGLSIHLLDEKGRYRIVGESRAFPGWTAEEIHAAMNEPELSAATAEVLNRVGRVLGERDGTDPEDTLWFRIELNKAHTRGRSEGHAEGHQEGHAEGHQEGHAEGHQEGHAQGHREGHAEGHSEGRAEGHREGHAEGRREQRAEMAEAMLRSLLASREISWRGFDAEAFEGVPTEALVDAALRCADESDLLQRLEALRR